MSKRLRILLVEDDPLDADLLREAVDDAGVPIELLHVEDCDECVERLAEGRDAEDARPGLVLLDLRLSRRDGLDLLADLKRDERTRAIPVVVFSASSAEEDVSRAYRAHANAYLVKPLDHARTVEMLRSLYAFFGRDVTPAPVRRPPL